ncbi:hypothetical protein Tel_13100 [Candidatus Tenderia electrophaga]|jgi:uncharacterized tellurite resistance protein B-like protein|uniref:Co-chaperone DjlA N-terminal domain-containing protein n=1 Tax=Candidatus Tenderia electrophaga TaxID=1748243 RepID=A0A0S2TFR8_9GAMM|nr:hypothetical protein Tel_13100 [Candidatus Tenderia electrophaga]
MLKSVRRFFDQNIKSVSGERHGELPERALQLATASLLVEVSRADFHINAEEREAVVNAVEHMFSLSHQETREIVELAESEIDDATSLYEFTRLVNDHFDYEQKLKIVELLWRVCYADLDKDKYEEHLIRKISDLIYVTHSDFVRMRHRVETQ